MKRSGQSGDDPSIWKVLTPGQRQLGPEENARLNALLNDSRTAEEIAASNRRLEQRLRWAQRITAVLVMLICALSGVLFYLMWQLSSLSY